MKTLKDVMPPAFIGGEFNNSRAFRFKDDLVLRTHGGSKGDVDDTPWPGKEKHVFFWVELTNGTAVGFNENPGRGWGFPVLGKGFLGRGVPQ